MPNRVDVPLRICSLRITFALQL